MHHAGTSIVANLTMMLGANGGTLEGMLLHPSNPLKYWERADVVGLDQERLAAGVDAAAARYTLPDWVAYGFDADKPATKVHSTAEAKGVVAKLNAQRPWVTKDPRMSLVASEWVELLDAPACVIVHREPLSIANSMMIYSHNVSYAEWAAVYEAYYGGVARACAIVYTISETHSPAALPSGSASDGRPGELLWRAIFFAVAASFAARFARFSICLRIFFFLFGGPMRSSAGMGRVSGAMRRWTRFFLPMVLCCYLLQLHSDGLSASNDSALGQQTVR